MEYILFRKSGWFYLPASIAGLSITLVLFLHALWVARVIDSHSHSVSDTLYNFFPFACCTFYVYEWLAKNMAGK